MLTTNKTVAPDFYSRTSCEVRRGFIRFFTFVTLDFYSRTSCEVRREKPQPFFGGALFLLTHLMRGATKFIRLRQILFLFLLTHLMRGATGRDNYHFHLFVNFYSRTSCEVRHTPIDDQNIDFIFLLTHLMRGAT